jgi:hypothetical protein
MSRISRNRDVGWGVVKVYGYKSINRSIVVHRYISIFRLVFDASSFKYFWITLTRAGGIGYVKFMYTYCTDVQYRARY